MNEKQGELGVVFELVYANGQAVEVLKAIHGKDLPPDGSEEKVDFLDDVQGKIEKEIAATGLTKALEEFGLNGQYLGQKSRVMTDSQVEEMNKSSVLERVS